MSSPDGGGSTPKVAIKEHGRSLTTGSYPKRFSPKIRDVCHLNCVQHCDTAARLARTSGRHGFVANSTQSSASSQRSTIWQQRAYATFTAEHSKITVNIQSALLETQMFRKTRSHHARPVVGTYC